MRAALALALVAVAASARADVLDRPLVLAPRRVEAGAAAEFSLGTRTLGQALALAPAVRVGVTARLTLGVVHGARDLGLVTSGDGWCPRGVVHGCADAYRNLALDARWSVRPGVLAAHAMIVVRRFDPLLPGLRLGALGRWRRGPIELRADPYLQLGLANRDRGNRAIVGVPIWFAVAPTCRWALYLHTGVRGELAVFGDAWAVPIALGTKVALTPRLDLSAEAGFERLGGPLNSAKQRDAWIAVDRRW